jgi:uncharacterized membrane protein YdjX (TVP38/TMEM64 family)
MKWHSWLILGFWGLLLVAFWVYLSWSQQTPDQVLSLWLSSLAKHPYSAVFLFLVYLLRPLLLFPITILTVFAGFLYGPLLGTFYALLATLASSSLAYFMGRFFGRENKTQSSWMTSLRERSFETVLTSRLLFLPGDIVNYTCGFLRISFVAFIVATALGGLPGLLVGTLAGASIEGQFDFRGIKVNPWYIGASVGLLAVSLLGSYVLRRKEEGDRR